MAKKISEEDVRQALAIVKHPAIDCSLLELGIIKNISIKNNKIIVTIAFPFAGIPIKEYLMNSVREPIAKLGAKVEMQETIMTDSERESFLKLESEHWTGGR